MKRLTLVLFLLNIGLGFFDLAYYVGPLRPLQTEIFSYEVLEEGPEFLELAVSYAFTDEWGKPTFMGGSVLEEGVGIMEGSFRPVRLKAGRHTAELHIGLKPKKVATRCTTELEIDLYIPQMGDVYSSLMPFKKCWGRTPSEE